MQITLLFLFIVNFLDSNLHEKVQSFSSNARLEMYKNLFNFRSKTKFTFFI